MNSNLLVVLGFLLLFLTGCIDTREKGIKISEADLYCETNSDCMTIQTQCSQCNCGEPVNIASAEKYRAEYRQVCENYSGAMCDMNCKPTRSECINNKCVLIEYDESPEQYQ